MNKTAHICVSYQSGVKGDIGQTLSTVVEDIGVVLVLFQSFFEAFKGLGNVTTFHEDTCKLDPSLGVARQERD